MSSFVDMSLEDIIKKKREKTRINKPKPNGARQQNLLGAKKVPITDARNKIISKKRIQITDAREKLAQLAKQKDARLKLEKLRQERASNNLQQNRNNFNIRGAKLVRAVPNKDRVFLDATRQVVSHPLNASKVVRQQIKNKGRFTEGRLIGGRLTEGRFTEGRLREGRSTEARFTGGRLNEGRVTGSRFTEGRTIGRAKFNSGILSRPKPILRTVENDIEIIDDDDDDPMGEEYTPQPLLNRKASLQLKIVTHNNDIRENRSSRTHRFATTEKEKSPPRPPSILKKRPMAALRTDNKVPKIEKPTLEYRIIVSNLRSSVTSGDIQELFGDVGGMVESRLVRPGTAEVIYMSQSDAQRAVDLYHNRQLDGQPMNCLLVTPRLPTAAPRSSSKPALYSTNSNVEPDISTFHKVLFSNL